MKKMLLILIIGAFLSSLALANGLNLNSLGSRALAMGGAFVGLADDYSAIFWNPAGIAHFKSKYFGFYGTDIIPSGTYKLVAFVPGTGNVTLIKAKTLSKNYLGGLAAYYHPITSNLVAGIGVYSPAGLGAAWDGEDFKYVTAGKKYDWRSKIGIISISPALAYRINDMVSVGACLNINYGTFDLLTHAGSTQISVPPYTFDLGQYEETMTGWGYGATLGVLVKLSPMVSLGATFRTASTIKFDGQANIQYLSLLGLNGSSDVKRDITWPMWLAFGAAVKPMENLTVTGDIQFTQWSKIDVMKTQFVDPYWAIMMSSSGDDKRPMYWRNATQIRFGAEYKLRPNLDVRAGFYHDPSPAPDRTMNVLLPNYNFNAITAGVGYSLNGLQLDFGVEYLIGSERTIDILKTLTDPDWESAMPGTYGMKLFVPSISISYTF